MFVAMPDCSLPTNFQLNILNSSLQGEPSKFTTVIEAKRQKIGPDRECPRIE